jgi:membrane-bound ClpP family serine protease
MNATKKANPLAHLDDDVEDAQLEAPEIMTLKPKVSVALTPRLYYSLVEFCSTAAKARGKRVTHVEVFRALASELFADEALRKRVINRLRGDKRG